MGNTKQKQQKSQSEQAIAFRDAATSVASAFAKPALVSPVSGGSPARVIDQRSKLYKQLGELNNLHKTGVLSEQEYETEKQSIVSLLHNLRAR